jgi:hypothetical protein
MNPKRLAFVVVTVSALNCFHETTYAQGSGGPEGPGGGPGSEKPAPKPRVRWQKPVKLPEQYRTKDKDSDGQIGMYEWDRRDYATFRKLDLNHDGFLTAEELIRGASSKSARPSMAIATAEPASKPVSTTPASGTTVGSEAPATLAADASDSTAEKPGSQSGGTAAPTAASESSAGRSESERQWEIIDKDKDGKVSEAEWGRSYLARPKFRDAGIAVTFPLGKDEFIQLYSQLPGAGK